MRSFQIVFLFFLFSFLGACIQQDFMDTADSDVAGDTGYGWEASEKTISSTQVETLIAAGRAQLGTPNSNCKTWVQAIVPAALGTGYSIPSTASNNYSWSGSTTSSTSKTQSQQKAQWIGSYANKRLTTTSALAKGSSTSATFTESYGDPQIIVLYASASGVTATATKGSTSISVSSTSSSTTSGTLSTVSTATSTGTWTLKVTNNSSGSISAGNIVAVVLSNSRFTSDWQTAQRGDIMQMYGGTSSTARSTGGPHTTFVQVTGNTGTNWLDANWVENSSKVKVVGEHAVSVSDMMKMMAYSSAYGFTVYRIN